MGSGLVCIRFLFIFVSRPRQRRSDASSGSYRGRLKSQCAINRTDMARMNSYLRRPTLPTPAKPVEKTSGDNFRLINELHIKDISIYKRKPGNPNT